jgi:hypothetical protein
MFLLPLIKPDQGSKEQAADDIASQNICGPVDSQENSGSPDQEDQKRNEYRRYYSQTADVRTAKDYIKQKSKYQYG